MMKKAPPQFAPMVQQGYDPAVGLAYEITDLAVSFDTYGNTPMSEIVAYHAPRIGGHMKGLLALVPPPMIDSMFGALDIEMIDENNAIVKPPASVSEFGSPDGLDGPSGPNGFSGSANEPMALTRYNGRWLPKGLVDGFQEYQSKGIETLESKLDSVQQASEATNSMLVVSMVVAPVNSVLDSLLAANTQEAFDAVINQAKAQVGAMAGKMLGGMEMDAGNRGGFDGEF